MAAECEETRLDLSVSDFDSSAITCLQAVCRGWLVRKKLRDTQIEFQQIVQELDGPAVMVEWTSSSLPHPKVCKVSKKRRSRTHQNQMQACDQHCESKPNSFKVPKPTAELDCPKCAEKMSAHTEKARDVEKSSLPTASKPNSDKTQSDQEVQTEFLPTCQQSEETHGEKDQKQDSAGTDCLWPVKEAVCQTQNHFQTNRFPDQYGVEMVSVTTSYDPNQVAESGREQYKYYNEAADSRSDKDDTSIPFPSVYGSVESSRGLQPSAQVVGSSEGVTASESSGMRRVDSFHGDQTSVWDSSSSGLQDHESVSRQPQGRHDGRGGSSAMQESSPETGADLTEVKLRSWSTEELVKQKQNVAMELLWVQQAIISRKKYLKLKVQMEAAT